MMNVVNEKGCVPAPHDAAVPESASYGRTASAPGGAAGTREPWPIAIRRASAAKTGHVLAVRRRQA